MWTKDWTVDVVESNYKVIGVVDHEDLVQLFADSRELAKLKKAIKDKKQD